MQTTRKARKPWWVNKPTALLQEYAHTYGGTYVPASFKDWRYTGQHVRIPLGQDLGTVMITVTEPSSGTLVVSMKYDYRPRRRLEFHLCAKKRPLFLPFHSDLLPATLPISAMNKTFHSKTSHPSLLRSILKQEGLHEALELHPRAYIKLRHKQHQALLSLSETSKKPDAQMIDQGVRLLKRFIAALHEQGYIRMNNR